MNLTMHFISVSTTSSSLTFINVFFSCCLPIIIFTEFSKLRKVYWFSYTKLNSYSHFFVLQNISDCDLMLSHDTGTDIYTMKNVTENTGITF